nr:putative ribonuclease H-like domain-containing protein [Tanacetum cinerariifolium]
LFNPLFKEEIIPMKIDPHPFNDESDLIESMLNHDSSIIISSKIDSLCDEFAGELTLLKLIPSGINETDCYPEEETHFTKRLLYDNSSPRLPEEFVYDNSDAEIESFSLSPIPNEDSDSHMEEIDLSFTPNDPMPSSIEDDDYDSERDIPILEELLDNYFLSLPENESYHFDIPSPSRPPTRPLDASRLDIMFVVCACVRFQVTPKTSHLHAVKRIFRYLKGQPKLALWYPRDSPFDLVDFSNSDYTGASLDRKFTTGGFQFLGKRLTSWQCKKQTIVANSTTKAEYVVATSCCRHVLWIQNQMLDYGFNLKNTKIYIDNESTICIVKNPVFHSKTKHIEIRHHFIRDSYEKKLIQVIKIHIDHNVVDLLTKAFDFWTSTKVKTINDDVWIQALVDGKKVIVNEASIRHDLRLDDAEGTACLLMLLSLKNWQEWVLKLLPGTNSVALWHLQSSQTKTTQAAKIKKLKKKVKKLKGKKEKRTHGLKILYKIGLSTRIVSLDKEGLDQGRMNEQDLIGVHDLDDDKVFVDVTTGENVKQDATVAEKVVTTIKDIEVTDVVATTLQFSKDELTLAHTLMKIKAAKPKAKGAMIDADKQLAQKSEQISIEERSKILAELIKSGRKYFAAKISEEIRNKPPTKAQQKSIMCTYMKNMEGYKQKDFKGKSFDDIKKMFEKVYKRVNTFVDMNTEIVQQILKKTQAEVTKGSSKRAGEEIEQESAKKQKLDEQESRKNLHIEFLENKPIVACAGPEWLFDIDMLTKSMNYVPVITGTNSDDFAGIKDIIGAGQSNMETRSTQDYIFMPLWKDGSPLFDSSPEISGDAGKKHDKVSDKESEASNKLNYAFENLNTEYPDDPKMLGLETIATYDDSKEEDDFTNLESSIYVSPIPTTKNHKNHPLKQVIGILNTPVQTRSKLKPTKPTRVAKALSDLAWVEALREELLRFKLQKVYILVDLPKGKKAIGTKWVFRNKKDERGIVIKNKARLVAQGHTQEEGIDYDEFFAHVARIEAIRLFLAYASFMRFMVYQMDAKVLFFMEGLKRRYMCVSLQVSIGKWVSQRKDRSGLIYQEEKRRYFACTDVNSANTLVDMAKTLVKDADGDDVDVHLYRSMIGSLMYLTTSRPDIMGCQFLGSRLISWQCKKQTMVATSITEAEYLSLIGYENLTQKLTNYNAFFSPQWKFLIHTILQCLSAKTTAWNEFSSTMASAIICLATYKNFDFSKYIFNHMVKNLEDGVKFLMFPRFVQVFLDSQVEGMLKHKEIYVTPSHTKKIFTNMKKLGKEFSGKVTPLLETIMVQPQEDMGKDLEIPTDSHHTPTITQPSTSSQPQQKQKFKKSKKKIIEVPQLSDSTHNVVDKHVTTTSTYPLLSGSSTRVESSEDVSLGDQEDTSKQGRMIDDLDVDEGATLVDETRGRNDQDMFDTSILDDEEVVVEKEVSTADLVATADEVVTTISVEAIMDADYELAARLQEEERGELTIEEKSRLFVELMDKKRNILQDLELKISEMLFNNTIKWIESFVPMDTELMKGSKKASEGSSKRARDDDVKIEATPLSSKSPTIVDYKIYKEGRKSFFKIIRADGNSQNYLTFRQMFKNFNREDLGVMWSIVKAKFMKTKPVDDIDSLLFQTLKIMFKHHVEDNIWKYQ